MSSLDPMEEPKIVRLPFSKNGQSLSLSTVVILLALVIWGIERLAPFAGWAAPSREVEILEQLSAEHRQVRSDHLRMALAMEQTAMLLGKLADQQNDHRRATED